MSKRENEFYYSYSSAPVQPSSSSQSTPSAPPTHIDSIPPSYDEATTVSSSSQAVNTAPPNKHRLDGYVLDASSPPFNPNIPMNMPEPMVMPAPEDTSDYGPYTDSTTAEVPLLGEFESRQQEYEQFAGRPAPPGYSLYRAKYETRKEGILSRDTHINHDGEALLQFLYQHNQPPLMKIKFYGYHEETRWKTVTRTKSNGDLVNEREPTTHRIDDFNFDIDVSNDISNVCQGLYILPDPKTGEVKSLRDLCNDYIHEKNILKELKLKKEIQWDFNGLTRGLTTAIRNSGFYEHVEISFLTEKDEIIVKTDHYMSRWVDNKFIRFFFFITFLWIFSWPIIYFSRKRFGHNTLKSAWNMNVSERDWYSLHVQEIVESCRGPGLFRTRAIPSHIQFHGTFRE